MKENWLEDIENRMSYFEVEEPVELWERVEAQLPREEKRKTLVLPWWRRGLRSPYTYIAAAVALLIFVVSVFVPLFRPHEATAPVPFVSAPSSSAPYSSVSSSSAPFAHTTESAIPSPAPNTASAYTTEVAENHNVLEPHAAEAFTHTAKAHTPALAEGTPAPAVLTETLLPAETLPPTHTEEPNVSITEEAVAPAAEKTDTAITPRPVIDRLVPKDEPLFADNDTPKRDYRRTLAFSAYCSGGLNASSATQQTAPVTTAVGADGVAWEDAPMLGIMLYNQGLPTRVRYKHYMPIRGGVHLAYRFHSLLAVETGVVYSCLLSDYEDGSDMHYIAGRQTLHYIGVPLNLTCRIYSWRQVDIYGSVGGMAELCVGGTQRTDYVLNSKTEKSTNERITEHPWQFSTTFSLGAQYNCLPWLGVYLEPGATYRFSDHSSIESIYSQRPFNFSLNLGVRFSL